MKLDLLKFGITSILILPIIYFSGYLGWSVQFISIGLVFFLSLKFVIKKNTPFRIYLLQTFLLLFPFLISYGISIFLKNLTHVYPLFFIAICSAAIACIIHFQKTFKKGLMSALAIIFICVLGLIGMPNWLNYTLYSDTDYVNQTFPQIEMYSLKNDQMVNLQKGKVYVVDIWSTICRPCIEKFPEFEELKINHSELNDLEFITLCLPVKNRDFNYGLVKNFDFNSIYAPNPNAWHKLDVKAVPKYLVLNRDLEVVYRGSMNNKWYHFYNNINSIIKDAYSN